MTVAMTSSPLSFTPRKPIPPADSTPSKNLDGTVYCNIGYSYEEGFYEKGFSDSLLSEKIFIYFPDNGIYGFFCKKPEEGKPIEVRVGNEWKILERVPSIRIDSTSKYLRGLYVLSFRFAKRIL